jgi:hypothetical protein
MLVRPDPPQEVHAQLGQGRQWLGQLRDHHIELVRRFLSADGGNLFPLDLFILGVANRSYEILDGYLDSFDKWNVFVAGPLVRLQLDNLVRVSYVAQQPQPHDFVMKLIGGAEFRGLKHSDGERLMDGKLVRLAAPMHPWLPAVYEAASGWVHLSPLHISSPLTLDKQEERTLRMEFPLRYQDRLSVKFLAEIQGAMTQATEELFGYIEIWEERKEEGPRNPPTPPDPPTRGATQT